MAPKRAFREARKKLFADAGLVTLAFNDVPAGTVRCVQHVSVKTDLALSGGNDQIMVVVAGHGEDDPITDQITPVANDTYWYDQPFWLVPGERLEVELDEAQAATTVTAIIRGYDLPVSEGVR